MKRLQFWVQAGFPWLLVTIEFEPGTHRFLWPFRPRPIRLKGGVVVELDHPQWTDT